MRRLTRPRVPVRCAGHAARPCAVVVVLSLLGTTPLLAGCTGGDDGHSVTVAAAASLTDAFTELGERFEAEHPGTEVVLTFGGSSALVAQIEAGAPVDVVATADEDTMDDLGRAGLLGGEPVVFATNELVVIVPAGNPSGVAGIADLAALDVVALCAPEVPCGRYAASALERSGVELDEAHVTRGPDATATTTAVASGDADAGIVYRTDLLAASDALDGVDLPAGTGPVARYPIATVGDDPSDDDPAGGASDAFVELVTGPAGAEVLARHGFGAP